MRTAGERSRVGLLPLHLPVSKGPSPVAFRARAGGRATITKLRGSQVSSDPGRTCSRAEPPKVGRVVWWRISSPALE